jgi:hypothetical protein
MVFRASMEIAVRPVLPGVMEIAAMKGVLDKTGKMELRLLPVEMVPTELMGRMVQWS